MRITALGVDIGHVLSVADTDTGRSLFTDDWLQTPYVDGAVESLTRLNTAGPFAGRISLVSKCGPHIEARTRQWLNATGFPERTGITEDRWHFVRQRADKADVCQRLHITHFVDDRISVLTHLDPLEARFLFAPERPPQVPPGMTWVADWPTLEALLTDS